MNYSLHLIVLSAIFAIVTSNAHWWLFLLYVFFIVVNWRRTPLPISIISCIVFLFFHFYTPYYEQIHSTYLTPQVSKFNGTIVSQPVVDGDLISFRFKTANGEQLQFRHRIGSEKEQKSLTNLSAGWSCRFDGILERPDRPRNFYSFDYREFLQSYYGIHWMVEPISFDLKQCRFQDSVLNDLYRYRNEQMNRIKSDFPAETAGMINALVFGDRNGIDEQLIEQYQSLGLIHLLAVSGLHVGSILGLIYIVLIRCGVTKESTLWMLLGLVPLIIVLTGGSPSVVRAGVMAAIVCICTLLRIKMPVINQLSIVCLLLLLIKPNYIFHLGFQLSFLITFSLLLSNKIISKYDRTSSKLLAASIIAQLASIPIVLWNFYQFSLWSLPLNMVLIPALTLFILPLVFITFILYLWIPGPVWHGCSDLLQFIFMTIHHLMNYFSSLPFGTLTLGKPSLLCLVLLCSVLLWLLMRWEVAMKSSKLVVPIMAVVLTFTYLWTKPYFDPNGYVTMIDVGQGDAFVIELPYRKGVFVVDTGGHLDFEKEKWQERKAEFDTGKDIVVPYLKARGVRTIDRLILTHGDADHIGGAFGVIESIPMEKVLYGKSADYENSEQKLIMNIQKHGIPVQLVHQGMEWTAGATRVHILGPTEGETAQNNRSVLLYFDIYGTSFLLTGDMEAEKELQLIKAYPQLTADVLKIGHHGSDTSTSQSFLDQMNPQVALISVGVDNRYQHPSATVVERLEKKGIPIYRTDRVGAVRMTLTPKGSVIETVLSEGE